MKTEIRPMRDLTVWGSHAYSSIVRGVPTVSNTDRTTIVPKYNSIITQTSRGEEEEEEVKKYEKEERRRKKHKGILENKSGKRIEVSR